MKLHFAICGSELARQSRDKNIFVVPFGCAAPTKSQRVEESTVTAMHGARGRSVSLNVFNVLVLVIVLIGKHLDVNISPRGAVEAPMLLRLIVALIL